MQSFLYDKRLQHCPHNLPEQVMSCSHGCGAPWTGRVPDCSRHDLTSKLQTRVAGPALTSLRTCYWILSHPSEGSRRGACTTAAAAQESARSGSNGTMAETLVDGVTQSLALALSAASIAADSLARIQRVVAPLPAGFPPGAVCMHAGLLLTMLRPRAFCPIPLIC